MTTELVLLFSLRLLYVNDIQESEALAVVRFDGGHEGRLLRSETKEYSKYIERLRTSREHGRPVVVTLAKSGQIVAVELAEQDTVRAVKEDDAKKRASVLFWKHAAVYYLSKNDPEYRRVKDVLTRSEKDRTPVWVSLQIPQNLVVDALLIKRAETNGNTGKE